MQVMKMNAVGLQQLKAGLNQPPAPKSKLNLVLKGLSFGWKAAVILILSSCANSSLNLTFPAQVSSIDGFDSSTKGSVTNWVNTLDQKVGQPFLDLNGSDNTDSTVQIKLVPSLDPSTSQTQSSSTTYDLAMVPGVKKLGMTQTTYVAGRATRSAGQCVVEIAEFVTASDDLLQAVLWHELGHCAGLMHSADQYQIMSTITYAFSTYSADKVAYFFKQILTSISVN